MFSNMEIIDRIVMQRKAPENKHVLWIDTSSDCMTPNIYRNGEWRPLGCGCGQPHPDGPILKGSFSDDFNNSFDI